MSYPYLEKKSDIYFLQGNHFGYLGISQVSKEGLLREIFIILGKENGIGWESTKSLKRLLQY